MKFNFQEYRVATFLRTTYPALRDGGPRHTPRGSAMATRRSRIPDPRRSFRRSRPGRRTGGPPSCSGEDGGTAGVESSACPQRCGAGSAGTQWRCVSSTLCAPAPRQRHPATRSPQPCDGSRMHVDNYGWGSAHGTEGHTHDSSWAAWLRPLQRHRPTVNRVEPRTSFRPRALSRRCPRRPAAPFYAYYSPCPF